MTLPLLAYRLATGLLQPVLPMVLKGRVKRGKEDAVRWREKLARGMAGRPEGSLIWIHGASVGETLSALPLIEALLNGDPTLTVLVTSGTPTSAEILARRLPARALHQYAPVDAPGVVSRFLDHWRPALIVLLESELWPNLIGRARARGVPLALVSARITDHTAKGWRRWPASARTLLSAFALIAPQDRASAGHLSALGARVGEPVNLKRVGAPLPAEPLDLARLRTAVGDRNVVVLASTHEDEELALVAASRAAGAGLTIIVPRHPERGEALSALLATPRRSRGATLGDGDLHLADTLGELGLFLRLADVVVLGGSFRTGVGGHNPLEPARLGKPSLTGPDIGNWRAVFEDLVAAGASEVVPDIDALRPRLTALLADPARRQAMGRAGEAAAGGQDQALTPLIERLLAAAGRV